jgi:hypothetical protein
MLSTTQRKNKLDRFGRGISSFPSPMLDTVLFQYGLLRFSMAPRTALDQSSPCSGLLFNANDAFFCFVSAVWRNENGHFVN